MARLRRSGRVVESVRETQVDASQTDPPGLWAVAMLRVAMELKRPGARGFEEIVEEVAARMDLPKAAFRSYLATDLGLLRTSARARGGAR
jgi:hypothetical protein